MRIPRIKFVIYLLLRQLFIKGELNVHIQNKLKSMNKKKMSSRFKNFTQEFWYKPRFYSKVLRN